MNKSFLSHFNPAACPGREQNLFIGIAKHIFCLKNGNLKYHKKELDPRISNKQLITRYVLLDVDTAVLYGECHKAGPNQDLAGFLARAWTKKPSHLMHGIPKQLNISKSVREDDRYRYDILQIQEITGLQIGELPSGFSAGVHAVKLFDQQLEAFLWHSGAGGDLFTAQACSAIMSTTASGAFANTWEEKWSEMSEPSPEFYELIDGLYDQPDTWESGPFKYVLNRL